MKIATIPSLLSLMQIGLWCVQSQFSQFLLFLHSAEQDHRLPWPKEALKYESISSNLLNDLSQLAMETAMCSIIWIAMRRSGKTLSSSYWTINSRISSGFDIFMLFRLDSNKWSDLIRLDPTSDPSLFIPICPTLFIFQIPALLELLSSSSCE